MFLVHPFVSGNSNLLLFLFSISVIVCVSYYSCLKFMKHCTIKYYPVFLSSLFLLSLSLTPPHGDINEDKASA